MSCWSVRTFLVGGVGATRLARVVVVTGRSQALIRWHVDYGLLCQGSKEARAKRLLVTIASRAREGMGSSRLLMLSIDSAKERRGDSAD